MEQRNCVEESTMSENPLLRQDQSVMSQDLREELQGNSERSQPTETQDDAEARDDFWSIEGDFIFRRHTEPRVHLYVPKEESFPIPLKYIDATRTTEDDYWNVDVDRHLTDSRAGCTKCTWLNEKPPGYMWSGRRFAQIQAATRPDYFWPEIWIGMSEAARKKEMQEWAIEKPKLDNARRLRGIYFLDPEDEEYKDTIKNAKEKVGGTDGSCCASQADYEEAFQEGAGNRQRNQRIQQNPKDQVCLYCGSSRDHKEAFGVYCSQKS